VNWTAARRIETFARPSMKLPRLFFQPGCVACLMGVMIGSLALANALPGPYLLTVPALQLVTSEKDFAPFARRVSDDVVAALRKRPTDPAELKLLLGLRVHLALHFKEDTAALEAAEQIRSLQTEPGDRAHAGLTTRAVVAAGHQPEAFEKEFHRLLAGLPKSPEVRAALVRARARIAGITERSLLDEVRQQIAPRLERGEPCTLEIADQLVRIRHRLTDIVPLRDALLRAYDAAISAQA
jgi:hypothetical protein